MSEMEFVWVMKREDLFEKRKPQDACLLESNNPFLPLVDKNTGGFFVERAWAEKDPCFKQIIPYCVVIRPGNGEERSDFLVMTRLKKSGETRLHGLKSIGVGGHINPIDLSNASKHKTSLIKGAAWREIEEEIEATDCRIFPVGTINFDADFVGSVHFGFVFYAVVKDAKIREVDKLEGEFVDSDLVIQEAIDHPERFENWSRMLLLEIAEIRKKMASA